MSPIDECTSDLNGQSPPLPLSFLTSTQSSLSSRSFSHYFFYSNLTFGHSSLNILSCSSAIIIDNYIPYTYRLLLPYLLSSALCLLILSTFLCTIRMEASSVERREAESECIFIPVVLFVMCQISIT